MNTVTVNINGVEYNLRGKEDERYLRDVAAYVDGKIREISVNNKKLSIGSAAVLTAVNIADELFKCDLEINDITKKKNSLEERHLTLKERLRELKVEIEESTKSRANEVDSLKNIIFSMEEKLREFESIKAEKESLSEKVKELSININEKDKSIESLTLEVNELRSENEKLTKSITNCTEEIKNRVAIEDYEEVTSKLQKVQRINTILISENNELKEEKSDNIKEINELKLENSNLKNNHQELMEKINEKEIEFEQTTNNLQFKTKEEITLLNNKLNKAETELEDSKKKREMLKARNKELGFQVQNFKYKVLDLEKKLIDTQFNLAVEKKDKNPLLR